MFIKKKNEWYFPDDYENRLCLGRCSLTYAKLENKAKAQTQIKSNQKLKNQKSKKLKKCLRKEINEKNKF